MSDLVSEDKDFLFLYRYIHDEPDNFSRWEFNSDGTPKYTWEIHEAERYACFELRIDYRINKETGEVKILGAT